MTLTDLAMQALPRALVRAYRLVPAPARGATLGLVARGSTSHLALAAMGPGVNGWAVIARYARIVPRTDGGFWGDWGT